MTLLQRFLWSPCGRPGSIGLLRVSNLPALRQAEICNLGILLKVQTILTISFHLAWAGKSSNMRVLITGITGQDGSYMADFLLDKGHDVYGLVRRSSLEKYDRIESIVDRIKFVEG